MVTNLNKFTFIDAILGMICYINCCNKYKRKYFMNKNLKEVKGIIQKISSFRFDLEALLRILLNCIWDDSNLKSADIETLTKIMLINTKAIRKETEKLNHIFRI